MSWPGDREGVDLFKRLEEPPTPLRGGKTDSNTEKRSRKGGEATQRHRRGLGEREKRKDNRNWHRGGARGGNDGGGEGEHEGGHVDDEDGEREGERRRWAEYVSERKRRRRLIRDFIETIEMAKMAGKTLVVAKGMGVADAFLEATATSGNTLSSASLLDGEEGESSGGPERRRDERGERRGNEGRSDGGHSREGGGAGESNGGANRPRGGSDDTHRGCNGAGAEEPGEVRTDPSSQGNARPAGSLPSPAASLSSAAPSSRTVSDASEQRSDGGRREWSVRGLDSNQRSIKATWSKLQRQVSRVFLSERERNEEQRPRWKHG